MELWERSAALALLEDLLHGTADAGRLALVAGEAGIGKSMLVQAFAAQCGSRARVLWGVCDPLVTPRASGPLHDIARQAGGALADALDAGSSQSDQFAALIEELSGPRQRPRRVLVVEDVQWADEATLDMLVFLGRRIARLPALLIVTYRDDEVGPEHPLRAALAALPRGSVRVVAVTPLSRECVAEQVARAGPAAAGRDPGEVYELTGGNPLLVTELLAADDRAVPATVRHLTLARLRRLSPPARDVARLVSVIPTSTDAAVLVDVEEAVDECLATGVLVARGDAVAYRHELLRRAVEDSLSPARRAALHRRALSLLAGVDGTDPARLVHHARLAGDVPALLRYGVVAAARAASLGAHREAAAHYRAVRPHVDRLPARERAELLEAYAFEAYLAGVAAEGLEPLRAALAERGRSGERVRAGDNLRWISRLEWWSGHGDAARATAMRAIDVLATEEPGRELAMAYSNRSQLHLLAHELDPAIEWGERARELADRLGDLETSVHASITVITARLLRGDPTAAVAMRRVHADAAAAGLADHASRALVNLASSLVDTWRYVAGAAALDEAFAYASAHDLGGSTKRQPASVTEPPAAAAQRASIRPSPEYSSQYLLGVLAGVRLERCEWDAALAAASDSLDRPVRFGRSVVPALVARGRILAARGLDGALSILDIAADHAYGIGEPQEIGPVASARAEYFLLEGDPDRAAEEARRGLAIAQEKGHHWFADELAYRLHQAGGPAAVAPPAADAPLRLSPYRLLMAGDWSGAAAAWAALGRGYARVEALSAGDRGAVAEALGILAELGAVRTARRLRAELRRRGVAGVPRGPRPSSAANAAGLTARQMEVLGLLAEGLTNADIAARLTLSPKTVENHISAVLDKLEVATRGQAVAAARRRHLVP
jgi:DNA-binding CsgD family transcriptional regulator